MSHPGSVDIIDFLAFTIYPFLALGAIELISRAIKIPSWKKLSVQGVSMIILSVIYVVSPSMIVTQENNVHVEPLWMSILVMLALAATLFYQARRSKIDPSKAEY
jgi:peptidoglycan/LPS O-acetylase OafA/YrhL